MLVKEYRVEVRQFLTKPNPQYPDKEPVPFRIMFGTILEETTNGVKVSLKGRVGATSTCMRCGRTIKNPTSLQFGLGSECIHKVPGAVPLVDDANLEEYIKDLAEKVEAVTWTGWLPKGYIEMEETGKEIEVSEPEVKEEPEEPATNRLYPELTYEQEALVEKAIFNWMAKPTLMKPTEIWIEKKGEIKLVLEGKGKQTAVKIDTAGGRTSAGIPYAPKYKKIYELNHEVKKAEELPKEPEKPVRKVNNVDEALVNALAEELNCLL